MEWTLGIALRRVHYVTTKSSLRFLGSQRDAGTVCLLEHEERHVDLVRRLNTLAGALEELFLETGETRYLDEGVSAVRKAITATPPQDPSLPLRLNTLA